MAKSKSARGRVAWLITWEHTGEHARPAERVAAILSHRRSERQIAELLEFMHVQAMLSPSEKLALAVGQLVNPYPVTFDQIYGVRWRGRMFCGHNPHLWARLVDNIRVVNEEEEDEHLEWDERPRPNNPDVERQLRA